MTRPAPSPNVLETDPQAFVAVRCLEENRYRQKRRCRRDIDVYADGAQFVNLTQICVLKLEFEDAPVCSCLCQPLIALAQARSLR